MMKKFATLVRGSQYALVHNGATLTFTRDVPVEVPEDVAKVLAKQSLQVSSGGELEVRYRFKISSAKAAEPVEEEDENPVIIEEEANEEGVVLPSAIANKVIARKTAGRPTVRPTA